MALQIFNNISSINARRVLSSNNNVLGQTLGRVASGIRVQKSSDDGGALSLSVSLRSDTRALQQAENNTNDGQSLVSTAEGGLNEISTITVRLKELAQQAATGTIGNSERQTLQLEFKQLTNEIDRIANSTEFNGQNLLNGDLSAAATNQVFIQIGTDSSTDSRFNLNQRLNIDAVNASQLGLDTVNISTQSGAVAAVDTVTAAVDQISKTRASVAAVQLQIGHAISNLSVAVENMTQAESTVRDADLGQELTKLTKQALLVQSGTAMVSQANLNPQAALLLL